MFKTGDRKIFFEQYYIKPDFNDMQDWREFRINIDFQKIISLGDNN